MKRKDSITESLVGKPRRKEAVRPKRRSPRRLGEAITPSEAADFLRIMGQINNFIFAADDYLNVSAWEQVPSHFFSEIRMELSKIPWGKLASTLSRKRSGLAGLPTYR